LSSSDRASRASLLTANLAALSHHSPAAAERLSGVTARADLAIVRAQSGELTARLGARSLHSAYDPAREARRLVEGTVTKETTTCVVLGLGLGHHVQQLLALHPDLPVVVVEPDLGLLLAALSARDLRQALGSTRVRLLLGATPEEVAAGLDELPLDRTSILAPASLTALDPEYYRRVEAAVRGAADRREINANTLARFGLLWVRNLLRNVDALVRSPGVTTLTDRFPGLPALVVAAGPTLDEIESQLGALAERMVVIAVDSTLAVCHRNGLCPDFVVTVDPQYWNTRYFDRLQAPTTVLICEPSTHPAAFRRIAARTVVTGSLFPLGRFLEVAGGEKGRIGAGGSVATSAWDVARLMGCTPIYTAGLDLGFPGQRTHTRGLYFEEHMVCAATRLEPAETQGHRYLTEAGSTRVAATGGGTTPTDRRMLVYRWWFEQQLARPGAPATHVLSALGVRVSGMSYRDVQTLMGLPRIRDGVEAVMEQVRRAGPGQTERGTARAAIVAALRLLGGELDGLAAAAAEGLRHTQALEDVLAVGGSPTRLQAVLVALDTVDRRIASTATRDMAGFLMQPMIRRITATRGAPGAVEGTRSLYSELQAVARVHAELVRTALLRLEP
jgi:hypothetical protein